MRFDTTVEVHDGRAVLVRTGDDGLEAEARRLAAIAGNGVPAVLEVQKDAARIRLVTTFAPALVLGALDGPHLASTFAALAGVLARAHGAGVTHGPIEGTDVRIDGGQVQLEGWRDETPEWSTADDVAALGQLLEAFATTEELRNIASRATTPNPSARPAASGLAVALLDVAGVPARRRLPGPRHIAVGLMIVTAVLLAASLASRHPSGAARPHPAAIAPTTVRAVPASTTTSAPDTPTDVVVDANSVVRNGLRWTVGRPGDVVVIGDWTCDGVGTPAVLRPANGRVWRFTRWADDGRPIAGQFLATVPGATNARVRRSGSCDRLEVFDANGQSTLVG